MLDFPVARFSIGLVPWLVSIWVDEPWKVALWAVGSGLDLLLILVLSGNRMLTRFQPPLASRVVAERRPGPSGRRGRKDQVVRGAPVDPAHLSERLGLLVIIVLGEPVAQVVHAAGDARYGLGLLATGICSFVLLAGMFGLSVVFGYAVLPHLRAGRIPIRAALVLHCLVTGVASRSSDRMRTIKPTDQPHP